VRVLFRWLGGCFTASAFTIAVMAIDLGGIRSPYMHGISLVALVWAALIPTDWRHGLPTLLPIGLSFPVVMGIGSLVSPQARGDWMNGAALTVFVSNYVFVLSSSTLGAILSHLVWKARQQARKVGSYYLEERLGMGGMGEVWRARHHLLARRAAIKLIRPEGLGADPRTPGGDHALRARSAGDGVAWFATYDRPVRLWRLRYRHVLLRDGTAGRPRHGIARPRLRAAAGRARALSHRASL
jgi:hypothetical protein